uniref:Tetratricopeptide repeat protein n=1 Tax=Phaeodactylum tricornutum TaxID=2850 RepID=A0A8J9SV36_PHATR
MSRRGWGSATTRLYYAWQEFWRDAARVAEAQAYVVSFGRTVLWPLLVTLTLTGAGFGCARWVYRTVVYPPSASELHAEGLRCLTGRSRLARAEALWRTARQRDPTYTPVVLSLAAYFLYRRNDPVEALRVLDEYSSSSGCSGTGRISIGIDTDPDVATIRLDALAMQSGQTAMVQSLLAEHRYLSVASLGVSSSSSS